MKPYKIKKAIANGDLIEHYPADARPLTINSFLYNDHKYAWSSNIKHFVKVS